MFRFYSLIAILAFAQTAFCNSANADPTYSIVRITIYNENKPPHIEASGNTRLDIVSAALHALKECELPTNDVTVGPYLRLPAAGLGDENNTKTCQYITIWFDTNGNSDPNSDVFIGVSEKVPFKLVTAIASELHTYGITGVRLISELDVQSNLIKDMRGQHRAEVHRTKLPGEEGQLVPDLK